MKGFEGILRIGGDIVNLEQVCYIEKSTTYEGQEWVTFHLSNGQSAGCSAFSAEHIIRAIVERDAKRVAQL